MYVYDQSMKNPTAAAFSGPVPPAAPLEADEDTQLFYYYYDDDVDDTQVKEPVLRCLGHKCEPVFAW